MFWGFKSLKLGSVQELKQEPGNPETAAGNCSQESSKQQHVANRVTRLLACILTSCAFLPVVGWTSRCARFAQAASAMVMLTTFPAHCQSSRLSTAPPRTRTCRVPFSCCSGGVAFCQAVVVCWLQLRCRAHQVQRTALLTRHPASAGAEKRKHHSSTGTYHKFFASL